MLPSAADFERSTREQIAINRARTPTERMQALCDLLDAARAMAPMDPESIARRRRVYEARQKLREKWRDEYRRFVAAYRNDAAEGV